MNGRPPTIHGCILLLALATSVGFADEDLADRVEHGYATNPQDGTKIHYVSVGEGPLVVFIHGFPDYWYSWEDQMERLSGDFRCVAMDLRGYNRSDQPEAKESYDMSLLVQDVMAVIKACGEDQATVVGHDWGGAIAWTLATYQPDYVDKLVICNLPHLRGLKRELMINDEHRANTQYARDFQDPEYHKQLSPERLVGMLSQMSSQPWTEDKKKRYQEAFARSDFNGMLNYYRQNYNPELGEKAELPYEDPDPVVKVAAPVLMFHGLKDPALHHHALNNTWEWVDKDLTIVTLPEAGHWSHHDAAPVVSSTLHDWLRQRP